MEEAQPVATSIETGSPQMEKIPDAEVASQIEKEKKSSRYYWVDPNKKYFQGVQPPVTAPQKVDHQQASSSPIRNTSGVGSAWNAVGTWEERSFDPKDVQEHVSQHTFAEGDYTLSDLKLTGDHVSVVTSKGKKKVGYHLHLKCKIASKAGKSWKVNSEEFTEYADLEVSLS